MKKLQTFAHNAPLFAPEWPGLTVWAVGWFCMFVFDGQLPLGSLAMLLVLTTAVAALWLRLVWSLAGGLLAVLAFNWFFVPPRHTFAINLQQDMTLLIVMFAVSLLVAILMSALRKHASQLQQQALMISTLRVWGDTLRDAANVLDCLPRLRELLTESAGTDAVVLALCDGLPGNDDMQRAVLAGSADEIRLSGLWHSLRSGHVLGPGSGRYQHLPDIYLPLRGRNMSYGAALLPNDVQITADALSQAQALCNQMGAALERQHSQQQQQQSDQAARELELRATLLTAIAHDYRTPLATIMGAASALEQQDARLNQQQRQQLAHRIVDESVRLRKLTGNILQLARLDAPGMHLRCDWETAEELVGGAMQRCCQPQRVQLELAADLPLLWCDSMLVSQLLDNLLDNACKYTPADSSIRLAVRHEPQDVVFAVCDKGPGIAPELQQLVFQPFRQGQALALGVGAAEHSGVGVGLALCRVVATAHGGELILQSTAEGSCFEFRLPRKPQPLYPTQDTDRQEAVP